MEITLVKQKPNVVVLVFNINFCLFMPRLLSGGSTGGEGGDRPPRLGTKKFHSAT